MSDMKMSDVFHLPLTADKWVVCSNPYQLDWLPLESQVDEIECGSEKEAKMVAHEINNHDQLAEENAELREILKKLIGNGIDLLNVDDVEDEEDAASIHAKFNDVVNSAGALLAKQITL